MVQGLGRQPARRCSRLSKDLPGTILDQTLVQRMDRDCPDSLYFDLYISLACTGNVTWHPPAKSSVLSATRSAYYLGGWPRPGRMGGIGGIGCRRGPDQRAGTA
jgi:hypothetical protein